LTNDPQKTPLISLVVPVFNEEANIGPFYDAVVAVTDKLQEYRFEFVFTDNHSTDSTFHLLRELALRDRRVRAYRFSRNFGFQRSIMTGYSRAQGDAAIQLDVDLQDPPELIGPFLEQWRLGAEVVYGVRVKRQESWVTNMQRVLFYRLIDHLSEEKIPVDAGDFRLISRRVIDLLKSFDDAQPYLRGTIATLRLSTYFGLAVSAITLLAVAGYTAAKLIFGSQWPAGFATLAAIALASISINAMLLGIIGEYIGRIYRQIKKQPLTIIEEVAGVLPEPVDPSI
jgi:dolichol-phosphate mannosyltransferase